VVYKSGMAEDAKWSAVPIHLDKPDIIKNYV